MDKSALANVTNGTLITSATSAISTAIYVLLRRNGRNVSAFTVSAALNSSITAATFFTIREFVVSPILVSKLSTPQYTRRRRELRLDEAASDASPPLGQLSWSDLRMHKILDTGISGALAGGALLGWKRGPRAILPGSAVCGVAALLAQLAYNELGIVRLKYISRSTRPARSVMAASEPQSPSLRRRFLTFLGWNPLSDEEYLETLKEKRELYLRRIKVLEEAEAKRTSDSPSAPDKSS